jgi:hypothetical protein
MDWEWDHRTCLYSLQCYFLLFHCCWILVKSALFLSCLSDLLIQNFVFCPIVSSPLWIVGLFFVFYLVATHWIFYAGLLSCEWSLLSCGIFPPFVPSVGFVAFRTLYWNSFLELLYPLVSRFLFLKYYHFNLVYPRRHFNFQLNLDSNLLKGKNLNSWILSASWYDTVRFYFADL